MHQTIEIRRLPGGSIDASHYARIGRELHGNAVRDATSSFVRLMGKGIGSLGRRQTVSPGAALPKHALGATE